MILIYYSAYRQHLKHALDIAAAAQDNYLRGLVLALIVAHYTHTAEKHAWQMLKTCEMLAAGLGAPPKEKSGAEGGNVVLGIWVGERMLGKDIVCSFRNGHL
jgi:hypothetical protein